MKFSKSVLLKKRTEGEIEAYLAACGLAVVGKGSSRRVYKLPNGKRVIKVAVHEAGIAQNRTEWRVSKRAAETVWVKHIAKVFDTHPKFKWLIAECCEGFDPDENPVEYDWNKLREFCKTFKIMASDISDANLGVIAGRAVLVDYGLTWTTWRKFYEGQDWYYN